MGGKPRDRAAEQAAITAAAERLLAAAPLRSATGKLTVSEMITESGLRRDIVYDHPHLIDGFKARAKARDTQPAASDGKTKHHTGCEPHVFRKEFM